MNSFDPFIPLSGNYFKQTGPTHWLEVEAGALTGQLQSSEPPECRTVLGIVGAYDDTTPTHYSGPAYFDLDSPDIAEVCEQFRGLLGKLQALSVDLEACRLFASGSKGFHIEIPQALFMARVPAEGVVNLPAIYKEVAHGLFVDTLDLRVYSCRKGRMWRVPNRRRENGNFKVPLTVPEALGVTAETYAALVSAPRPFPPLAAPELCSGLALMYCTAKDKVTASAAKRAKRNPSKTAELLQVRCKAVGAALPPSLLALGAGLIKPRESAGFNQICIQLCTAAHALGLAEDALLTLCAGLIQNHAGDGARYGTAAKRQAALREMFRYTDGNPCYEFSVGGVRSIFPESASLNDMRGL
ncbi:MAG: hypothetical protein WBH99_00810 [Azovibrio sp.]|uniref:hypothetical protein n=1 Tax=Azovibrio sp. TaxID=1872673 RepID=UPI003C76E419